MLRGPTPRKYGYSIASTRSKRRSNSSHCRGVAHHRSVDGHELRLPVRQEGWSGADGVCGRCPMRVDPGQRQEPSADSHLRSLLPWSSSNLCSDDLPFRGVSDGARGETQNRRRKERQDPGPGEPGRERAHPADRLAERRALVSQLTSCGVGSLREARHADFSDATRPMAIKLDALSARDLRCATEWRRATESRTAALPRTRPPRGRSEPTVGLSGTESRRRSTGGWRRPHRRDCGWRGASSGRRRRRRCRR